MMVGIFGSVLFIRYLYKFADSIQSMSDKVKTLETTILSKEGNPAAQYGMLVHIDETVNELRRDFESHTSAAERHYQTLEDVNSEDHWKNCPIDKCVHFQDIIRRLDRVVEKWEQFEKRADESRANTVTSIEGIRGGQKDLGKELGDLAKLLVGILTDNVKNRGYTIER